MDNKLNYTEENEEREDGKLSYRTPIYLQLREIIRNRIEEGEYLPGTAIPSENKLAETYGINSVYIEVKLHIEITELITMPLKTEEVKIETDVPLTIKVIQGSIPNYYQQQLQKDSSIFTLPIE